MTSNNLPPFRISFFLDQLEQRILASLGRSQMAIVNDLLPEIRKLNPTATHQSARTALNRWLRRRGLQAKQRLASASIKATDHIENVVSQCSPALALHSRKLPMTGLRIDQPLENILTVRPAPPMQQEDVLQDTTFTRATSKLARFIE